MLFADSMAAPSSEHVVTLGTLGTLILAAFAGILKYYRNDVFEMLREHRAEREAAELRYAEELRKRDESCSANAAAINKLAEHLEALSDRFERVEHNLNSQVKG